jgi:hypothetical protein
MNQKKMVYPVCLIYIYNMYKIVKISINIY